MPRHRAPSSRRHVLSSLAVTGAAIGVSLLTPPTATAAPGTWTSPTIPARPDTTASGDEPCDDVVATPRADDADVLRALADAEPGEVVCVPIDADTGAGSDIDSADHARPHGRQLAHRHWQGGKHRQPTRPMTSGEHQQRNGCLQGYIVEDCKKFSVENLLRHGIDPFQ